MAAAARTWNGEWWRLGGGGTVWDSMAYDPELDLLYIGTGNGSPWNQALRSPGGGDNLFLSSIVALRPDDGAYVWHYQTTPGESWDYTATQPIIVADLHDRRRGSPRRHAGAEERFLLRARCRDGHAHLGRQVRGGQLGERRRSHDGAADRESRRALRRHGPAGGRAAVVARRAQLASDGVQPADRARLSLRERQRARLCARPKLQSESARIQSRHRSLGR